MKKTFRHIFSRTVWTLISVYATITVLLHLPAVQSYLGSQVESALEKKLGTKVEVRTINLGFLNRLTVDEFVVFDKNDVKMLRTARLSAKVDIIPLFKGRISISSAQIFGLDAHLYKETAESPYNFQFVIDSLKSKNPNKPHTPLDLHIASLVIRNGKLVYDQKDAPAKNGHFDTKHLSLSKISSHMMLYALTDDSIHLEVKQLSFMEKSGLDIKRFSTKLLKKKNNIQVSELNLRLPSSHINIPSLNVTLGNKNGKFDFRSTKYDGEVDINKLSFNDITPFLSSKAKAIPDVSGSLSFKGEKDCVSAKAKVQTIDNSLSLNLKGKANNISDDFRWNVENFDVHATEGLLAKANNLTNIPKQVLALGSIDMKGKFSGTKKDIVADTKVSTSKAGSLTLKGSFVNNHAKADITTKNLNIAQIISNHKLGVLAGTINAEADIKDKKIDNVRLDADIDKVTYNGYTFTNALIDGTYRNKMVDGSIEFNDPYLKANISGNGSLIGRSLSANIDLDVTEIRPQTLNLTNKWGDATISFTGDADIRATGIDDATGSLNIRNLTFLGGKKFFDDEQDEFTINDILLTSDRDNETKIISLRSDFADIDLKGDYNLSTISHSIVNLIASKLPTIPGLPTIRQTNNNISIGGTIRNTKFLRRLLGIDLNLGSNATIDGFINDITHKANININIPTLETYGKSLNNVHLNLWTPNDTLCSNASFDLLGNNNTSVSFKLNANAHDNQLVSALSWDNNREKSFKGTMNTISHFFQDIEGRNGARVSIAPSDFIIGDSVWHLRSNDIVYCNKRLNVNSFTLGNENQHLLINGCASNDPMDSLVADLHNINLEYILNLVNFHSVEFGGYVSGQAVGYNLFSKPEAHANINVSGFLFQEGHLGDLHCNAVLNNIDKQIDIDAYTDDENGKCMDILGYVSPQKNALDLHVKAERANLEFMHSWCYSFLDDIDASAHGKVRVFGTFKNINLEGQVVADGAVTVTSLNCRYRLLNDTITFIPDDILVKDMPMYDRYGHVAYMTGGLHHQHLTRMTYDFDIKAKNFLAYDFTDFGDQTFYGTAYMTGDCKITGRSSELTIDVNGDVDNGSSMTYNASSPDALSKQEFISWHSVDSRNNADSVIVTNIPTKLESPTDVRTNLRMNFLFNVTPGSTLHLLMDPNTGDYIDLHGSGGLRATYYNKGSFDLYGNYLLTGGTYKMTIQNVIRRDFEFQPGGSISFGGDPYNALLNMQAKYSLSSVSLSDLNIGSSFSSNNTKVDCLMNITGTPGSPKVDFDMDLPTINTDAKQMIYSLINSEEEMNQQVLYLLAVGRFYQQTDNNASAEQAREGQTSLAMQSILSGTVSQQINSVLGSLMKNSNISLGANIAPGNEGFNNAEYEGLLNGSLLNNRLQFNGQFGYRDNATTNTQGFIGDFDVRYLLFPNGNLAIRVYNQTNDRYFTRNSLNTQGLGIILKKDFNTWRDLFYRRRKVGSTSK